MDGNRYFICARVFVGLLMSFLGGELINLKIFEKDILNSKYSSIINDINNEISHFESDRDNKYNIWRNEVNGKGGTGEPGHGTVAKIKYQEYLKSEQIYREKIDFLNTTKSNIDNNNYYLKSGFLTDSKALFKLVYADIHVAILYAFWFLFILFLELIVFINKNLSSSTAFDYAQTAIEKVKTKEVLELENNIRHNYEIINKQQQINHSLNKKIINI